MELTQEGTLRGIPAGTRAGAAPLRSLLAWSPIRYLLSWSPIRYLLAGTVPLAVDFSVFTTLRRLGADPLLINLISRPLGGVTCFLVNRFWTFRAAGRGGAAMQFTKFCCVFAMSSFLSEALLALFTRGFGATGASADASKAVAEGLVLVFNFLCLKHWTFR